MSYKMSSSSQNNEIDLVIHDLFNFFDFPSSMSINMFFEDTLPSDLSIDDIDQIFRDIVKDREFVSYVNGLDTDIIVNVLETLSVTNTDTLNGKFALTVASVLSGKNAYSICKHHVFTNNYLMIMIVIRSLRQKIFITNIDKMHHPYKFYEFMHSSDYMKKIIRFLQKIHQSELLLYEEHNNRNKKILGNRIPNDIISLHVSQFTYGESRLKLQKRIELLIGKLKKVNEEYKSYYDKNNARSSNRITQEQFHEFVINKYGNIGSRSSSCYTKSSSLGNRRDIVVKNINSRM